MRVRVFVGLLRSDAQCAVSEARFLAVPRRWCAAVVGVVSSEVAQSSLLLLCPFSALRFSFQRLSASRGAACSHHRARTGARKETHCTQRLALQTGLGAAHGALHFLRIAISNSRWRLCDPMVRNACAKEIKAIIAGKSVELKVVLQFLTDHAISRSTFDAVLRSQHLSIVSQSALRWR